ncbi:MAG: hypothetical protein PHV34_09755 [Verrucomicrobiae bacterium]|nr:hypothetical protein [Verrucomicrobiae bacterium]
MASSNRTKKSKNPSKKDDELVNCALDFIDQAADLLKRGVVKGADETAEVRQIFKRRAAILIGKAADHLEKAVQDGATRIRSGLKKI